MKRVGYIYILSNNRNTTLYIGVTSDLMIRITQHLDKIYPNSFTQKYNLEKLVYWEGFNSIEEAIAREKQLKAGSRQKKLDLINKLNPGWGDLYPKIISGEIEI